MSDDANPPASPAGWISDAKVALARVVSATKALFEAHPDLQSLAADGLQEAANAAAPLAEKEIAEVAPPSLDTTIDAAIERIQAAADADAAKVQADAQARIAALQSAKTSATN